MKQKKIPLKMAWKTRLSFSYFSCVVLIKNLRLPFPLVVNPEKEDIRVLDPHKMRINFISSNGHFGRENSKSDLKRFALFFKISHNSSNILWQEYHVDLHNMDPTIR